MDYDDDELPPMPTFSGGASGNRGANTKATMSRQVASRVAISAATRASAISLASISNQSKNTIITSAGVRTVSNIMVNVNKAAINAAQKRERNILLSPPIPPKPQEQIKPEYITLDKVSLPDSTPKDISKDIPKDIPKPEPVNTYLESYKRIIRSTLDKKIEMLIDIQPTIPICPKKAYTINYISPSIEGVPDIDQTRLSTFCSRLADILKNQSNLSVLDEINNYQMTEMKVNESARHKSARDTAMINKIKYFTSDT